MTYPLFASCHIVTGGHYHDPARLDHEGLDFTPNDVGNPPRVPAMEAGRVIYAATGAGLNGTTELIVIIQHDGWWSAYGHLAIGSLLVAAGQHVEQYQQLATMGHSGYTIPAGVGGTHCHIQTGPGAYHGHLAENPTFDPMTKLDAHGGATDMDPTIIARGLRAKLQPGVTPSDEAVHGDAARMVAENSVEGVLTDLLTNLRWRSDRQHNIDANTSYADATGRGDGNPAQWAQDRVDGGDSFDFIIHVDAAAEAAEKQALRDQVAMVQAQLVAQSKPCPEPVIASTDGTPVVAGEHPDPTQTVPEAPTTTPAQPATEQTPASTPSFIQRLVDAFIAFLSRK